MARMATAMKVLRMTASLLSVVECSAVWQSTEAIGPWVSRWGKDAHSARLRKRVALGEWKLTVSVTILASQCPVNESNRTSYARCQKGVPVFL